MNYERLLVRLLTMKVVILAGGLGTRISEESVFRPKPMIMIGEYPIIVHIMKTFSTQGFDDFVICAGYRQDFIKEYFANYFLYTNDVTFNTKSNKIDIHHRSKEEWSVTVSDTGFKTATGGRVGRIGKYLDNEPFILTYGDGVADIDVKKLLECHKKSGKLATISVYNFGQSKGVVDLSPDGTVQAFREKSDLDGDLINIGFMVLEPEVVQMCKNKGCSLEGDVLAKLAKQGQLNAYIHRGYWQCMDTMRDKEKLETLWEDGTAPWRIWK